MHKNIYLPIKQVNLHAQLILACVAVGMLLFLHKQKNNHKANNTKKNNTKEHQATEFISAIS